MSEQENIDIFIKKFQPFAQTIPEHSPIHRMAEVFIDKLKEEIRLAATNPSYPSLENQKRIALEFKEEIMKLIQQEINEILSNQTRTEEEQREQDVRKQKLLFYLQEEFELIEESSKLNQQASNKVLNEMKMLDQKIQLLESKINLLTNRLEKIEIVIQNLNAKIEDITQKINQKIIELYQPEYAHGKTDLTFTISSTNENINFKIDNAYVIQRLKDTIASGLANGNLNKDNFQDFENAEIVKITKEHLIKEFAKAHPNLSKQDRDALMNETIYSIDDRTKFSNQFLMQVDLVKDMVTTHKNLHAKELGEINILSNELSETKQMLNDFKMIKETIKNELESTHLEINCCIEKLNLGCELDDKFISVLMEGQQNDPALSFDLDGTLDNLIKDINCSSILDKMIDENKNPQIENNNPAPELEEADQPSMRPR